MAGAGAGETVAFKALIGPVSPVGHVGHIGWETIAIRLGAFDWGDSHSGFWILDSEFFFQATPP
jgi:hypothetical protein